MQAVADWFIHGEVDWDAYAARAKSFGPTMSGVLFGAGWACWADALVQEKRGELGGYPFKYNWPGIVATVALILINLVPRRDLEEIDQSGEDGAETRARLWLLFSFLTAFGAVAGAIVLLVTCSQNQEHVAAGVGSVLQCGLILAAALLLWAFRGDDDSASGYF